jgi:hypothetical protein
MLPETSDEVLKSLEQELKDFEVAYESAKINIPITSKNTGEDWDNEIDGEPESVFGPGTLGYHELLDRTYMVSQILEETVLNLPSLMYNKEAACWLYLASHCLVQAYVAIGTKEIETE